jgi:hypothetical protein
LLLSKSGQMLFVRFHPWIVWVVSPVKCLGCFIQEFFGCFTFIHELFGLFHPRILFSHTFHFYTFAIISRFSPRTPRIPTKAKAKLGQGRQPHYTCVSHGTLLPAHAQYSTHCITLGCVHMSTRSSSVESCT